MEFGFCGQISSEWFVLLLQSGEWIRVPRSNASHELPFFSLFKMVNRQMLLLQTQVQDQTSPQTVDTDGFVFVTIAEGQIFLF